MMLMFVLGTAALMEKDLERIMPDCLGKGEYPRRKDGGQYMYMAHS
jgi:hypothetical protein